LLILAFIYSEEIEPFQGRKKEFDISEDNKSREILLKEKF
jgi:hypothetical protein